MVRDQCWINELLQTVKWTPEDLVPGTEDEEGQEADGIDPEEELQALLNGAYHQTRDSSLHPTPCAPGWMLASLRLHSTSINQ